MKVTADMRAELEPERLRLVGEFARERRNATMSLTLMTIVIVAGATVVGHVITAADVLHELNSVTRSQSAVLEEIDYRTGLLLDGDYSDALPPTVLAGAESEFALLFEQNRIYGAEVDRLLAKARRGRFGPEPFVDHAALNEFEASEVDPELLSTAGGVGR